jgi:hypothetical protein
MLATSRFCEELSRPVQFGTAMELIRDGNATKQTAHATLVMIRCCPLSGLLRRHSALHVQRRLLHRMGGKSPRNDGVVARRSVPSTEELSPLPMAKQDQAMLTAYCSNSICPYRMTRSLYIPQPQLSVSQTVNTPPKARIIPKPAGGQNSPSIQCRICP